MARMQEPPDEDLLEQYLTGGKSESEDAFRALVARHGPRVLGICRRVLDQSRRHAGAGGSSAAKRPFKPTAAAV